jgi:hypothetical protein
MKRAVLSAFIVLAFAAAAALADGGATIASAPAVVYGQQQFGNSTNGGPDGADSFGCETDSWWLLPTIAGDHVTVDWEGGHSVTRVALFPVGVTDYNARISGLNGNQLALVSPNGAGRGELTFTAPKTGSMPLAFQVGTCVGDGGEPGPYDFVATVEHAVRLFVPVGTLRRGSTVGVQVRDPDGRPITNSALKVRLEVQRPGSHWRIVGRASANAGLAKISVSLPRSYQDLKVSLRAHAAGGGYLSSTSQSRRVRVR